jgi:hypothetical protein
MGEARLSEQWPDKPNEAIGAQPPPQGDKESNADRINLDDPFDVRRWCQRFVCTEAALRTAVQAVGPDPLKVRRIVALGAKLK